MIPRPPTYDPKAEKLTMDQVEERLQAAKPGLYAAASVAQEVLWPGRRFRTQQGAGAAAVRMLKSLGYEWETSRHGNGWRLPKRK